MSISILDPKQKGTGVLTPRERDSVDKTITQTNVNATAVLNAKEIFNYEEKSIGVLEGDIVINTSFPGLLGTKVTNSYDGAVAVAGAVNQLTNDEGYWGLIGMTNSGSTILGGAFVNTFHLYNQGYADTLYTVDGNKDHVWYTDPGDGHNFTALTNEVMRLKASGVLNLTDVDTYADNAAAITGGLVAGDFYRTATGELMIVYTP